MNLKNKLMSILILFIMAFALSCFDSGSDDDSSPISNVSFYVDTEKNYNFKIGSYMTIEIAHGSFHFGTNFEALNGVYLDNLGVTKDGESNEVIFENSPEINLMMFDIVELIFDKTILTGSIKIYFDYGGEVMQLINATNSDMQRLYPGIYTATKDDIEIYYYDKHEGKFIVCPCDKVSAANKFFLNTQLPGIYVFALKPEVYGIWGDYILNH